MNIAELPKPVFEEIGGGIKREIAPITGQGFRSGRPYNQERVITPKVDPNRTGKKTKEELLDLEKGTDKRLTKLVRNPHYYKGTDRAHTFEFLREDQVEKSRGTGANRVRVRDSGGGILPKPLGPVKKPPRQPVSTENFLKGRKVRELSKEEKTQYEKIKKANQRYRVAIVKFNATQKPAPRKKLTSYITPPTATTSKISMKEALAKLGKTPSKNTKTVERPAPRVSRAREIKGKKVVKGLLDVRAPTKKDKNKLLKVNTSGIQKRLKENAMRVKPKSGFDDDNYVSDLYAGFEEVLAGNESGDTRLAPRREIFVAPQLTLKPQSENTWVVGGFRHFGDEGGEYTQGLHTNIRGPSGKEEQEKLYNSFLNTNKDYIENKKSSTDIYNRSRKVVNEENVVKATFLLARKKRLDNLKHPAFRTSTYLKDRPKEAKASEILTQREQNANDARVASVNTGRWQNTAGKGMAKAKMPSSMKDSRFFGEGATLDGNSANNHMFYDEGDNYQ